MLNVSYVRILDSLSQSQIKFIFLREGTDIGSPPHCELKVKVTADADYDDDKIIYVASRIEENQSSVEQQKMFQTSFFGSM